MPPKREPAPDALASLAKKAIAQHPDSLPLRVTLARTLYHRGRFHRALAQFEDLRDRDPSAFNDWHHLARCYAKLNRLDDALRASETGLALRGESAVLRLRQGQALTRLERHDEAREALERCVALGDDHYRALTLLLRPLAQREDATALLDYCDALPPAVAGALVHANRAIGLSRMGRTDEARALIDLDRDIEQSMIETPDGFASLAEFNMALARESLDRQTASAEERDILYCPSLDQRPVLAALLPVIRAAMEDYVQRRAAHGLDAALPPPSGAARLFYGVTILRKDGSNGEHIHEHGRVSAVYHVQVPGSIAEATDDRGSLTVGDCAFYSGGHTACWGERRFRPRAGMLTLFPSHVFHDVIPSGVEEPRISITADMIPM